MWSPPPRGWLRECQLPPRAKKKTAAHVGPAPPFLSTVWGCSYVHVFILFMCGGGSRVQDRPSPPPETYGAMSMQPIPVPGGQLIFKDLRIVGFHLKRSLPLSPITPPGPVGATGQLTSKRWDLRSTFHFPESLRVGGERHNWKRGQKNVRILPNSCSRKCIILCEKFHPRFYCKEELVHCTLKVFN